MNKTIVAIDPGASGGFAVTLPGHKPFIMPMPATHEDIVAKLRAIQKESEGIAGSVDVFLEQLVKHMGPGIPASTMAVYAGNWGVIKGACLALGFRVQLIRPQDWINGLALGKCTREKADRFSNALEKKEIARRNGEHKRNWKNHLKDSAQRFFPHLEVTLKTADSLLILEHAKRVTSAGIF